MQTRLIHSPAASLCIYALHIILAFKITHSVIEKRFFSCTPVSLVLDRNWYQLLADFQTLLPWQRQWKGFRRKKEWHCQLKSSRCSFYKFPCVHAKFLISLTVWQWRFFNLVSERLHLASECSSQRVAVGRVFWSWALSFISLVACLICSIVVLW